MLNFELICIQTFLWAGWATMFCKSPHIMFRFSENLLPCHLRELPARSLTVCPSLLLTPTLALHEHVRVSLSLPPSPSSLFFLCVYTCTLFLSPTSHTNAQLLSLATGFCQSFSLIVFRTESASRGARRNNVSLLTNTVWISRLFRALMRLQSHNRHGS